MKKLFHRIRSFSLRETNINIASVAGQQAVDLLTSFLQTILVIRYIGDHLYGKYQFVLSFFYLINIFQDFLNPTLKRFFTDGTEKQRRYLFAANVLSKVIIALLFIFGLIITTLFFEKNLSHEDLLILLACFLLTFFSHVGITLQILISSHEEYFFINKIKLVKRSATIGLIFLFYLLKKNTPFDFLLITLVIQFLANLYEAGLFYAFIKKRFSQSLQWPKASAKAIFNEGLWQYRQYFLPFVATATTGYLSNYLPLLIFGLRKQFAIIAYFEVARKLFKLIHKFIPQLVKFLLPTLIKAQEGHLFLRRWGQYSLSYLAIMGFSGIFMCLMAPIIMKLYALQFSPEVALVFKIFSLYLLLGAWSQANEMLVMSGENTTIILLASIARQIVFLFGTYLVFQQLTPMAMASLLCLGIGASGVTVFIWALMKRPALRILQFAYIVEICLFVPIIYILPYNIWPAGLFSATLFGGRL